MLSTTCGNALNVTETSRRGQQIQRRAAEATHT